jgi:copper chaperone CopZ
VKLSIEGMTCAGCVSHVEKALSSVCVVGNSLLLRRFKRKLR